MFPMVTHRLPQRPLYISENSQAVASGDRFTVTAPPNMIDDDLMIFFLFAESTSATVSTAPSGWTQRSSVGISLDGTQRRLQVYTKLASSESGNYLWIFGTSSGMKHGIILCYRHCNSASPDALSTQLVSASGNSHTLNSLTPSTDDCVYLICLAIDRIGTSQADQPATPAGMVLRKFEGGFDADKAIMVVEQAASEALALGTRATETANSTAIAAVRMTFAKKVL